MVDVTPPIAELLARNEGPTIDFKSEPYDLSGAAGKQALAKDILCMANTPRSESAYILLGVRQERDGSKLLVGVLRHPDDADLQSIIRSELDPPPAFSYSAVVYDGASLGVIEIPPSRGRPSFPAKARGAGFDRNVLYFRRGSQNDVAMPADQSAIWAWFHEEPPAPHSNIHAQPSPWERYVSRVDAFSNSVHHLLILGEALLSPQTDLSGIGTAPWTYVFDFDPQSDSSGFLASIRAELTSHRALHVRVLGDRRTTRAAHITTTWYYARGLVGRADSISPDARAWKRTYTRPIQDECDSLAGELLPDAVVATIIWRGSDHIDLLREVLKALDVSLQDSLHVVIITDTPGALQSLADEWQAEILTIPLAQLAAGIRELRSPTETDSASEQTVLPSISGVPISLPVERANWIAEEIDLVPYSTTGPTDDTSAFLRGTTITWMELDHQVDARRDIQDRLTLALRADLEAGNRSIRINLYHKPGAGGTTTARRALWEIHSDFPSGLLRRTSSPQETVERLDYIHTETGNPVLLAVDGSEVDERTIDDLAELVAGRRLPVVILQILRKENTQRTTERVFQLDSHLSPAETERFVSTLSRDVPAQRHLLTDLAAPSNREMQRPMYFALTAYGGEFLRLSTFVSERIREIDATQSEALVFAAIATKYAQQPIAAAALRDLFGIPSRERVDFGKLLPPAVLELLVEIERDRWRIGHALVADEVLQQLLSSGADVRSWKNHLADWGVKLINFCRGEGAIPSDHLLDLAQRVFVYRDSGDVLGTEQSRQRRFSHFLSDIPVSEGRLRVLEALVDSFPDEHHFWAHLARFYGLDRRDYPKALECADRAVELAERDSVMYHVRGMIRRYQVEGQCQAKEDISAIVPNAELASVDFARSREINPENEYAHIAEAQMLIRLLEYAKRRSDGTIFDYLAQPSTSPYLSGAFDQIEEMLGHIRREREGVAPNRYEQAATAQLNSLYGDYTTALQRWDSLLARRDVYHPPVRRQIVWTQLERAGRDWSNLSDAQIGRSVELLERNLQEDPTDDRSLRLWLQAARRLKSPPSLEAVVERLHYWKSAGGSLDAAYYLYVLNALEAMAGSGFAVQQYERYLLESKERSGYRRRRDRSYEWIGAGYGLATLVHQSALGRWNPESEFWENPAMLAREAARVAVIDGPARGEVELRGGIRAFFVPARGGFGVGDLNRRVDAYVGFSYDGPRAWDVRTLSP